MADDPTLLTRRTAIKNAVALIGGTLTATQLGLLSDSFAAIARDETPRFLNREQFAMLSRVADLVIPETDTPGALGVGMPGTVILDPDTQQECPVARFDAAGRLANAEEAIGEITKAMRLAPFYPAFYLWTLGHAYYSTGRFEEAIKRIVPYQFYRPWMMV